MFQNFLKKYKIDYKAMDLLTMITEDIDQDLLDKLPTLQKAFTKIEEQNKELHFKDEDISSKNKEIDRLKRILESNNIEYDD